MDKNPHFHITEIIVGSSNKAESNRISRMVKQGMLKKIAPKIYTSNLTDTPEQIINRNIFFVLGKLFPKAVISHRSAFEFKPADGHIFLTYSYTRVIKLPGVSVHLLNGRGGTDDDTPFIEGLYLSKPERAFLENLQTGYNKNGISKTLPQSYIEEKLETILQTNGEDALNALRDKAKKIAEQLDMMQEFERLNHLIGALLSTKSSKILTSPVAIARAFGAPYDKQRLELFNTLFCALASTVFPYYTERNTTTDAFRNFAFYESYFSNYIEGTEFEIEDARNIVNTGTPMPERSEDSHDVLGTFYIVSNQNEMQTIPHSADELFEILCRRHRVLLSARESKQPGLFKTQNNRAGDTHFVDYRLVRGTLMKGFELYNALSHPFARALFIMFVISETHPFNDGNGRISRIMMNAELTHANQSKIIIPTVFRTDYILALRKLSRNADPSVLIHSMQKMALFGSRIIGTDSQMLDILTESNAFKDSNEAVLKI